MEEFEFKISVGQTESGKDYFQGHDKDGPFVGSSDIKTVLRAIGYRVTDNMGKG